MKKASKKRNRKAQDLTLINLDAIKKRLEELERRVDLHKIRLRRIEGELDDHARCAAINVESHNCRLIKLEQKKSKRGKKC